MKIRLDRHPQFLIFALLWLPIGVILFSLLRGMPLWRMLAEPTAWMNLATMAPFGLPLALAWLALHRRGHRRAAKITFFILAPLTCLGAVIGGLLGPAGIAGYTIFFSLPAWGVYGYYRLHKR